MAAYGHDLEPDRYIDIWARRAPEYDGMEKASHQEMVTKQWRNGWEWFDWNTPDPDYTTDQEFWKWYTSIFSS